MTTNRELMQQALDALYENTSYSMQGDPLTYQDQRNDDTIKALETRLAQPEPEHWSDCAVYNEPAYPKGLCNCGGFPVAWADLKGIRLEFDIEDCFSFIKKENYAPLYTAPPKKEWVGLTDGDVDYCVDAIYKGFDMKPKNEIEIEYFERVIKFVEAKLKEKNSG